MAIRVELWMHGEVTAGLEVWWDRMELALPGDRVTKFPLLSRVDPYGDATFDREELEPLSAELHSFMANAPGSVWELLTDLIALCERGVAASDVQLKFLGD